MFGNVDKHCFALTASSRTWLCLAFSHYISYNVWTVISWINIIDITSNGPFWLICKPCADMMNNMQRSAVMHISDLTRKTMQEITVCVCSASSLSVSIMQRRCRHQDTQIYTLTPLHANALLQSNRKTWKEYYEHTHTHTNCLHPFTPNHEWNQ